MELAQFLNSAQVEAVEHRQGPLLVIAGAGSGKTRVIEYRVLNLILNQVEPTSILLLTFTRRASREMLARAAKQDPKCGLVEGGTFHSFGVRLLRRYAGRIGIKENFTILDSADAPEAMRRVATALGYYQLPLRFPQKSSLQKILSAATNKQKPIAEILEQDYPNFQACAKELENLRLQYARYKLEMGYFDYDDLLLYSKLALEIKEIRAEVQAQFQYIMVDEYQDTNQVQGEIVALLAQSHGNVMAVGDDAQSIYGFRGAQHANILSFPSLFPGCKVIKLETNYRSTQDILDLGNQVLEGMQQKYSKRLVSAERRRGQAPSLRVFKEPAEEAAWIAEKIQELYHQGVPLREMAVLFRSSHLSFQTQTELAKRKLPFEVHGGKKFSDMAHVKDLLSYFKLLYNPKDELAWNRVLMLLTGVGPKTASRLIETIQAQADLLEVHEFFLSLPEKRIYKGELLLLSAALGQARGQVHDLASCYSTLLRAYQPYLEQRYDNWTQRKKDLETLSQIAGRYHDLHQLLLDFALEPPERGVVAVQGVTQAAEGAIVLSTIHSAKGLEWGAVFLIGMMEGIFPTAYSLKSPEAIEEEERLFYVALTRAKNQLFLSFCHYGFAGGITQFNQPSRFVQNLSLEREDRPPPVRTKKPPPLEAAQALSKEELLAKLAKMF